MSWAWGEWAKSTLWGGSAAEEESCVRLDLKGQRGRRMSREAEWFKEQAVVTRKTVKAVLVYFSCSNKYLILSNL